MPNRVMAGEALPNACQTPFKRLSNAFRTPNAFQTPIYIYGYFSQGFASYFSQGFALALASLSQERMSNAFQMSFKRFSDAKRLSDALAVIPLCS